MVYAPWLVANIHIAQALHDRPGPAPSWDNVLYNADGGGAGLGLGYVDATHQSLQAVAGPTVLTHYRALGDVAGAATDAAVGAAGRKLLQERTWHAWRNQIVRELSQAHPDLSSKATRMDITRYGHAMAIPVPQANGQIGLWPSSTMHRSLSKTEQFPVAPPADLGASGLCPQRLGGLFGV